jgi:hypothetical protein
VIETEHIVPAARLPADIDRDVSLTMLKVPPQVEFGDEIYNNPAGSVSAKASPARSVPEFEFVIVNVRLVLPFSAIAAAPKALLMDGGATIVIVAVFETALGPASVEVTALVTFDFNPADVPVTEKVSVQVAFARIVMPLKSTPAVVLLLVRVPQPALVTVFWSVKPAGSVSVKATPVRDVAFEFAMAN